MKSSFSCDHIDGDHIHTDIKQVTLRNHTRSTALERSVMDYWGWEEGRKHSLLDPNPRPLLLRSFERFGPHIGFATYH